ncbi:EF-hand domain-containing protein [Methylocystis sp. JAN1]|uniref:EF-hand domain-containing protein n=1 Tax=Methylocystis sp. JAN1 TaxID=3397211 RepID=UPI003FA1E9A2
MNKLYFAAALAAAALIAGPVTPALAKKPAPVAALDTDNDSTVDLAEVKKSAEGLFDKLDTDKDGSIEPKELHGRLSKKEFKTADPDNDGTLDKNEYVAVVEVLFKAADPDNDGTLDDKEFGSKEGKSLLRVVR